jgi:hypothetical protein
MEWIMYYLIWPCIILLGLVGNTTFIMTVIHTPALHTATYKYLVNLSISDLLTLLSSGIPDIAYYTTSRGYRENHHIIFQMASYFFFLCSIATITFVSLERFLAVCHPIKHRLLKGTKRTNVCICFSWICALAITFQLTRCWIFLPFA